ncbi:hypothetical protein Tco_1354502 [Tanacetum coccineum]
MIVSESSRGGIPDLEDTIYDIVHYMPRGFRFDTGLLLEYLKARHVCEYQERSGYNSSLAHSTSQEEFRQVHRDHDDTQEETEALVAYEETRATNALEAESQSQNGNNGDNVNGGNGNGRNGNGGNGNPNNNDRGARPNSHKRTIGADAAFVMSWREIMKLMAKVYSKRTKIQKMESGL